MDSWINHTFVICYSTNKHVLSNYRYVGRLSLSRVEGGRTFLIVLICWCQSPKELDKASSVLPYYHYVFGINYLIRRVNPTRHTYIT